MKLSLYISISLAHALNLQKAHEGLSSQIEVPETILDNLFSAYMFFSNPQAPSETMKTSYKQIIQHCIPDYDTVYIGIYLDDSERELHIRHVQTSVEGHEEHMNNAQSAVNHMVSVSTGMIGRDTYLAGPEHVLQSFRERPNLVAAMPLANPADFLLYGAKPNRFTEMNHQESTNLTFLMVDPIMHLSSGLTSTARAAIDEIIATATQTPSQVSFDVLYRSEDQMLTFREIYNDSSSAISFRKKIANAWKTLTSGDGSLVRETVAGSSADISVLKSAWEVIDAKTTFFHLYDGFQRVQART